MDINKLFQEKIKTEQKATQPRSFLVKVDREPVFSPSNPNVFKAIGTRTDTDERVVVITMKSASGQYVPKAGDVMRVDKASRDPAQPDKPIFRAQYFHTYEANDFCLNAVMQPQEVRTTPGTRMVGAVVHAYDPKSSATLLTGADVQSQLTASILQHLKQWENTEKSAITHDVKGKALWEAGPTRGLAPFALVRFASQSFKVFGGGAMFVDPNDKSKGERFPSDAELVDRIEKTKGVITLKSVIKDLISGGASAADLKKVDIAVVPGLGINVGLDQITKTQKLGKEYYAVPQAYAVAKEGGGTFTGHRETIIHAKLTRTGKVAVVDTSPTPGGKASAKVPFFANELAQMEERKSLAAGLQGGQGATQMTRAQALQMNDFPDEPTASQPAQAQEQRQQQSQPQGAQQHVVQQSYEQPSQSQANQSNGASQEDYSSFDSDDDFANDMFVMEQLGQGLDEESFNDLDSLLQQAEQISAQRSSPRMG
ncbi:hypothetical protein SJI00_20815 [Pseudomonas sp. RP23018S]|uniref:hypothetical protein n=1 Tax=Pseudomonas sp. RP23018S TaxID=3096037 RepID=UPI002ACAD525|nr:hypothetical protein [Pseudomonas sp. RP23018S]MDZ5605218.1 hypothetical protein [Pseudomonas sp. RP23018S]